MSRPSYVQTVAPTSLPLEVEEAMAHCRADGTEERTKIQALVQAATVAAQEYQWSQLITATWEARFDRFPSQIDLYPNPVQSVTVKYRDIANTLITMTADVDYVLDLYSKPARIVPAFSEAWPTTRGFINDVIVTVVAGYGEQSAVPAHIKQAILLLVGHWYMNRESAGMASKAIEFSTKTLLDLNSYRVFY